ncbi:TPA: PTS sugar transporter subunit IIA [Citrobacter freundii]
MLGWVITCHEFRAQELLESLEKKYGLLEQCRAVNFWQGMSSNMLSRMMCDALYQTDSGDGIIFLTDVSGAAPYRVASLMSHKHSGCEVIAGIDLSVLEKMLPLRETLDSAAFRDAIVSLGAPVVTSLWHQQQKNPPFVLKHNLYA